VALSLPWNCRINACPAEVIGHSIATQGVYDLPVTEAIIRLAETGDVAVDVGANIGYMALVLAMAVGPEGRVVCFEPNADVLPRLRANVVSWTNLPIAPIDIHASALSDRIGEGCLGFPDGYQKNCGLASLEVAHGTTSVKLCRLDSLDIRQVGLMKVDVEGHEAAVFSGAQTLLAGKRIRDILFEEFSPYPARSHSILMDHGYHIFRLTRSVGRPLLLPAESRPRQHYLPSNFVATVEPSRAHDRFSARGWYALCSEPRLKLRARN
jgi:FkbM family methyltransferase